MNQTPKLLELASLIYKVSNMKNDFSGDGKSDILVSSPWGIGLLGLSNGSFVSHAMTPNGSRLGEWLLSTSENNLELNVDFDGDGKSEILISSLWGIGVIKLSNGVFKSIAMAPNGTRHGGWIIDTTDNQLLKAGDFDKDGKEEVLISSSWGIGILKLTNGDIATSMLFPNGTRFGSWLLNTSDNVFTLVGDLDGDKQAEIVVTSPWGLGVLKCVGSSITSLMAIPNGTKIGSWVLNTLTDKFEATGDLDGDGKAEIVVSNTLSIGILKLQNNTLTTLFTAKTGDRLGSWVVDGGKNKFDLIADFDGDKKAEILVTSNWGIGILKLNGGKLESVSMAANGTNIGGWLLNTLDNRINVIGDYDADGKSELLITSPWGIGVLKQSGAGFSRVSMLPNGSRVGGWLLNTLDNDLEAGMGQSYGLIVSHNDWKDSVDCTKEFLKKRGYTVAEIPNGAKGVEMLKQHSLYLKSCDRLFVYFAGHGGSRRPIGDSSKDLSLTHDLQFEDGELIGYDRIAPSLQLMSYKGVDLSVLDGSCDGGEAVLNAIGERYLAMSTTTVLAPGLTNTPNPSEVLKRFGRPSKFGMWWSDCYAASLLTSITPRRFYQKIYRNDNTEINLQSLFYKPAIDFYAGLGSSWTLSFYCCYLHKYIFPDDYNDLNQNDKDKITVSTADYLALMKSMYDAQAPYIAKLNTFIGNSALVDRAGDVYGQFYPKPWQTIFGDMDWNLAAEPSKYSSLNNALIPGNYAGKQGFLRMVAEVKDLLTSLKQVYSTQEGLLKQIDVEILKSKLHSLPFKKQPISTNRILDYKKFNVFEKRNHEQLLNVLKQVNSKPTRSRTLVGVSTSVSELKVASKTIMIESELVKKKLYKNMYGVLVLNELIADLKTSLVDGAVYLDKLHYLLVIVEEAISKVQSTKAEPGDLCSF